MGLDNHGQPIATGFNAARNKQKAVFALKGLLRGIDADKKINKLEVLFLDVWLQEQNYLKDDGDVVDLLDAINDALNDGIITSVKLNEIYLLIKDVIKYKESPWFEEEDKVNELLGLISGMAADNKLNTKEINSLSMWLNENREFAYQWPISHIAETLNTILADGIITRDENEYLLKTIKQISGVNFKEEGVAYGMATDFFGNYVGRLIFENKTFCFTGTFISGTRNIVQNMSVKQGGIIQDNVNRKLDYLVIGTLGSRDWRFTSHGRKIEGAIGFQKMGSNFTIINEMTWLQHIKTL